MSYYKMIKRQYSPSGSFEYTTIGNFKATGVWSDGHLAYSRFDDLGNIIDEEEGCYYQVRCQGCCIMMHV